MGDFKVEVDQKNKILNEDGDPVVEIREDIAEIKKTRPGVTEPLSEDRRNAEGSKQRLERLRALLGDDFAVPSEPVEKPKGKRKSVRFDEAVDVSEESSNAPEQSSNGQSAYKGAVKDSVVEREVELSRRSTEEAGLDSSDEDLEFYADDDDMLDIEGDLMQQQLAVAYHSKRNTMTDYNSDAWDQEVVPADASLVGNPPPKSRFEPYARRSYSDKMINEQGDEEQVSIMIPRLIPGMKMGKYDDGVITAEEADDWDEYTEEAKQMLEQLKMGNREELPQLSKPESRDRVEVHKRPPIVETKEEQKPEGKGKVSRFKAARMQKM